MAESVKEGVLADRGLDGRPKRPEEGSGGIVPEHPKGKGSRVKGGKGSRVMRDDAGAMGVGDDVREIVARMSGVEPPPRTEGESKWGDGAAKAAREGVKYTPNPADDPTFHRLSMSMIDMVRLFKAIGGKKVGLRNLGEGTLGLYRYVPGSGVVGDIFLQPYLAKYITDEEMAYINAACFGKPDVIKEVRAGLLRERIKKDPKLAAAVLAHEIGHAIDGVPMQDIRDKGNILGHIANLHRFMKNSIPGWLGGPGEITKEEQKTLRAEARRRFDAEFGNDPERWKRAVGVEPIFEEVGIKPDDILNIFREEAGSGTPELVDWFSRLGGNEKVSIVKAAMKGVVDKRAEQFGKKVKVGERVKWESVDRKKVVQEYFREALAAEKARRMEIDVVKFKREAREVITWWRGETLDRSERERVFEPYYNKPQEMYAELFSVWLNNPDALKVRAPMVYQAFSGYMDARPEVSAAYRAIEEAIASGTNVADAGDLD